MTIASAAPAWLAGLLFLLLGIAAAEDGWRLRVSNLIVAAVAATGIAAIVFAHIGWDAWQPLLLAVLILGVGTPMFGAGWLGGGDVKLLAASGLWFSLSGGWRMLVAVAIAGGVLALLVLAIRLLPWSEPAKNHVIVLRPRGGIPYGIAIAMGVTALVMIARAPPPKASAMPSTSLVVPQ